MATVGKSVLARPPVQLASGAVGLTFGLVGLLGFVPGITTDYDTLTFAGHHTSAELLGIFQVSILHNIVHLLFGVAGLVAARNSGTARLYLVGGGAIYVLLSLFGMIIEKTSEANFVPVNAADDWLHLVLGIAMLALGVLLARIGAQGWQGRTA